MKLRIMEPTIHLARGSQDLGCFPIDHLSDWLADGTLDGSELGWQEGMTEWKSILEILEYPSATPKQRALLDYLGLPAPLILTIDGASDAIESVRESATHDASLREKLRSWRRARFELHPDLYATEFSEWKGQRAEEITHLSRRANSNHYLKELPLPMLQRSSRFLTDE